MADVYGAEDAGKETESDINKPRYFVLTSVDQNIDVNNLDLDSLDCYEATQIELEALKGEYSKSTENFWNYIVGIMDIKNPALHVVENFLNAESSDEGMKLNLAIIPQVPAFVYIECKPDSKPSIQKIYKEKNIDYYFGHPGVNNQSRKYCITVGCEIKGAIINTGYTIDAIFPDYSSFLTDEMITSIADDFDDLLDIVNTSIDNSCAYPLLDFVYKRLTAQEVSYRFWQGDLERLKSWREQSKIAFFNDIKNRLKADGAKFISIN